MSHALAGASRLKPEIRLAQAVSQFEADLSSEQKASFSTCRSQSRDSPPDLSDIMRLTAEIDRRAAGKAGGGRCFGPRLTNFLQAAAGFAALGDIILSTLLMTVGRSAPRYEMMALIYPRSKNLQSYLSEYFLVVVRLCHQLLKFKQKSIFGQVASTLSDSDVKIYQSELDLWANTIKEEVNLLMAKKIEEEAEENSRLRALSSKFSRSVSLQQKIETKLRLLNICSMYDHETMWKQTRKVGNATLFNRNAEYQDWKGRADSCTLIYTGKLGSGKSVLLANIVDDLNLHIGSENVVVAYFFCRHDTPESLKARTIIGSLARQLLRPIPDLATVAKLLDETTPALDFEGISSLLQRALPPRCKAYFILDGLDECDHNERRVLILQFRKLQELFTLLLCVSFRLEPNNALEMGSEQFTSAIITLVPDDNPDIEAFIGAELASCIESTKLVIGNPALILEIQDALLEKSQGMFLWVALQIESLCAMKTDDAIRQALADLPKDLSETFSRILRRSEESGKPYQRSILELVTGAHRPLTTEELREALSVVPGDAIWDPAKLLNDVYSTLACCGSLVTVDEEELTVRLVHHSVKQFLFSGFKDSTDIAITADSAKRKMADIIITYLNYDVFETQLSTMVVPQIMAGSVPSSIIRSTLDSSSSVRSLALRLLNSKKQSGYDIGKTLVESSKLFSHRPVDEFHFYIYAKSYWLEHVFCVSEQELVIYNLLLSLFKGNAVNMNAINEDGQTPLSLAAQRGYEAIVKLLLEKGAMLETKSKYDRTPLMWAIEEGHEAVVTLLLEKGAVLEIEGNCGISPLSRAISKGNEAIVKLLLERGAMLNNVDEYGWTPLSKAVSSGLQAMVKLLLEKGAMLETKDNFGRTPLLIAVQKGHEAVVKLLLGKGALLETKDTDYGQTPLLLAAADGHEVLVQLLIEGGATLETKDTDYGQTPLSWAAEEGHGAVVKLLLDRGALLETKDTNCGRTPLSWAAEKGHRAVVKLLLDRGALLEIKDTYYGQTPLSWAAEKSREVVVKLLLDKGALLEVKDDGGRTPLSQATEKGHEAVVKLLLDKGALLETKDSNGRTPLSRAAENGHEATVKPLLERSTEKL